MEVLLVVALIGILYVAAKVVVAPALLSSKEQVLKENLRVMRKAIDDYHVDRKTYPPSLKELVDQKYLKEMPIDPLTKSRDTWTTESSGTSFGDVYTVRSGSDGRASDGTEYRTW